MSVNVTMPVHLRYHQATIGTKFVSVSLSSPKVFGRCNGKLTFANCCNLLNLSSIQLSTMPWNRDEEIVT